MVDLNNVIAAAKADPSANQGVGLHPQDVLPVEKALASLGYLPAKYVDGAFGSLTIRAYSQYQRSLGYRGSDANGVPGITSLTRLGNAYGFSVTQGSGGGSDSGGSTPSQPPVVSPPPSGGGTGSNSPGKILKSQVVYSGPHDSQSGKAACEDAVRQACALMGLPATQAWVDGMTLIALRESAYNSPQWQVNKTDSNANGPIQVDGAPLNSSRGGWQCIPQTFADNHVAGTSLNIYDRIANCAAAMQYVRNVYKVAADGSNLAAKVQQADPNRKPMGY